jgi:hypothetical protein
MALRSHPSPRRWGAFLSASVLAAFVAIGCERDDTASVDRNRPPDTVITQGFQDPTAPPDPLDPPDLFYRAEIAWRGEDVDGRVVGYQFAVDDTNWVYTTKTDSVFRFTVGEVGSRQHVFIIRAIDNLGKPDPSPDSLFFESYTTGPPAVDFVEGKMEVNGAPFPFTGRDTVEVASSVKFVWTGADPDGFIVAWESKFDNEVEYLRHERNDTTRTQVGLAAGPHTMIVRGIDDAGAKSTEVGRFPIWSNFDPVTTVDRSSITSYLVTSWPSAPSETLRVDYTDDGVENDTLPSRGILSFCWSSTDRDGPIRDYFWSFAGQGEQTLLTCVDATEALLVDDQGGGLPMLVRARDVHGQTETPTDTVRMFINFPPTVVFTDQSPGDIPVGPPHRFHFTSDDRDSDPDSLRYQWRFSEGTVPTGPFSNLTVLDPDQLYVERAFTISEVGPFVLELRALELGGVRTAPDTVFFTVVSPAAAAAPGADSPARFLGRR